MKDSGKNRILVVDDELSVCQILSDMLKGIYEVDIALNGFEGYQKFTQNSYSAIVTDITMPQMTGIELLKKIREHNTKIPVIIITGYATIENTIIALRSGAFNFIQKPLDMHELRQTIRKAVKFYSDIVEIENIDREASVYLKRMELKYEFASDCESVKEICLQIMNQMNVYGFSQTEKDDIFFALYELIPNSIIHGNLDVHGEKDASFYELIADRLLMDEYRNRITTVECVFCCDMVKVVITDQGNGFDLAMLPSPVEEDNFFKLSGRGIFLAQFHVDELNYSDKGNQVTVIKKKKNDESV